MPCAVEVNDTEDSIERKAMRTERRALDLFPVVSKQRQKTVF